MNLASVLFPVLASGIALVMAVRPVVDSSYSSRSIIQELQRVFSLFMWVNTLAAVLFAAVIALEVACCSHERSLWLMPLIIAPIEYWKTFGPAIFAGAAATAVVVLVKTKR